MENILYLSPLVKTFHSGKSEDSYTGLHTLWFPILGCSLPGNASMHLLTLATSSLCNAFHQENSNTEILYLNVWRLHCVLSLCLFSIWVYGLQRVIKIYPNMRLGKYLGDTTDSQRTLSLFHFQICRNRFLLWTKMTYRLFHGYAFSFDCFLHSWSKTTEINWKTLVLQWFHCRISSAMRSKGQSNLLLHVRSKAFMFTQSSLQRCIEIL